MAFLVTTAPDSKRNTVATALASATSRLHRVGQAAENPMVGERRPSILVVDDEASLRDTLCAFLSHQGFRTLRADCVATALTILGTKIVDAAIVDVRLPDAQSAPPRSGLDLLAYLRLTLDYQSLPILMLTGYPLSREEEILTQRHHATVLHKPLSCRVLVEYLQPLLGKMTLVTGDPRR